MSINDCFDASGFINVPRYLEMMMGDNNDDDDDELLAMLANDDSNHGDPDDTPPPEKKRRKKRIILARRTEDGELEAIPPQESLWWHMYISCPQRNDRRFLQKLTSL